MTEWEYKIVDLASGGLFGHDHPREMSDGEAERDEAIATVRASIDRPEGVDPDPA